MADTKLQNIFYGSVPCIGGYAIAFGKRTLRGGYYFTHESRVSLQSRYIPVVRHLDYDLPPMGSVIENHTDKNGLYVAFRPDEQVWPDLRQEVEAGEYYFCAKGDGKPQVDVADRRFSRFVITSLIVTTCPCFVPDGMTPLEYISSRIDGEELQQYMHPIAANFPMERLK